MNSNDLLDDIDSDNVNVSIDKSIKPRLEKFLLQSQSLLDNVFRFIEINYQQSISLREVAEAVGRSPAYLTHLVQQKTGKTVLNWIIDRRMVEARRLLIETNYSVENIAEAVGYFDRRHFSRHFLRLHNTTPQGWRKKHQSKSIPFWQIELQKASLSKIDRNGTTTITAAEAQRLQACMQEIAEILNRNPTVAEILLLSEFDVRETAKSSQGISDNFCKD